MPSTALASEIRFHGRSGGSAQKSYSPSRPWWDRGTSGHPVRQRVPGGERILRVVDHSRVVAGVEGDADDGLPRRCRQGSGLSRCPPAAISLRIRPPTACARQPFPCTPLGTLWRSMRHSLAHRRFGRGTLGVDILERDGSSGTPRRVAPFHVCYGCAARTLRRGFDARRRIADDARRFWFVTNDDLALE